MRAPTGRLHCLLRPYNCAKRSIHCFQMGLFKFPLLTIADMSHYITPCHVTHMSCHVMSRRVTSRHITSHHVTSRHVTHASLAELVSKMSIHYFQMGFIKIPLLTLAGMSHYVTSCHITHMSRHTCHMCHVLYNQCSSGRR